MLGYALAIIAINLVVVYLMIDKKAAKDFRKRYPDDGNDNTSSCRKG